MRQENLDLHKKVNLMHQQNMELHEKVLLGFGKYLGAKIIFKMQEQFFLTLG